MTVCIFQYVMCVMCYAGYDALICAEESLSVSKEMVGGEGVFLSMVVRAVVFPRPAESVTSCRWSLSATGMVC